MDPKQSSQQTEVGYVVSSKDFLVYLNGFPTIRINDMVESEGKLRGWVNTLDEDKVEVLMLDEGKIVPKQMFRKLPDRLSIACGDFLLGRAIDPLGIPIDGKGPLYIRKTDQSFELEQKAPDISARQFINEQFLTGITIIDTLIPVGRGQRELVLGDAHSGKTSFLIDLIINQKGSNTVCVVGSIGKPAVTVRALLDTLAANQALSYTAVIATSASEPPPLILLTPKVAMTVAEYFQKKGLHVLLILDDLGTHAKIYREISLLGGKPPGRESYPGDIFYQHAHLLERAGNFTKELGGGSITALPVVELNLSDFTTLIPTNLMSMTDGHLLFRSNLFAQGQRPAIDIALSVSRVGRQTQDRLTNLLSTRVRQVLSQASDLETISRFSTEISKEAQDILRKKELIEEILKQDSLTAVPKQIQVILLGLIFTSILQDKTKVFVEKYRNTLIQAFLKQPQLLGITKAVSSLRSDEELIKLLEGVGPILTKFCP